MLELVGEILVGMILAIAEIVLDALLELAAGALADLASRLISRLFETLETENPVAALSLYVLFGVLAGGCSLVFFPHRLVRPSRIRGISLVVSPLLAGAALSSLGSLLRRRDKLVTRIESFRYGFAFAFGMAFIRFLFMR